LNSPLRVVVCGNSVLSAALADCLKSPGFDLACVAPQQPSTLAQILAGRPDVVLIEDGFGQDDQLMPALLRVSPALPLIQLHPLHSHLTIFESRQVQANRLSEVVELIEQLAQAHQLTISHAPDQSRQGAS
jgi:hypothetical protein